MHLSQGNNCKYVLKHTGLFAEQDVAEFKTEKELDVYIESVLDNDIEINGETAIFSVDHLSRTKKLLGEVKADIESVAVKRTKTKRVPKDTIFHNDGEVEFETELEEYYQIERSIGTTRAITTVGKAGELTAGMITPFDIKGWEDHFRDERGRSPETEKLIKQQEDELWPTLTQYGTDIHEVIDKTFRGEEYVRTTETKISDEQIAQVKKYAKNLMADLKKKHGATAEFYTEFAFKSKYLSKNMEAVLGPMGYDSINGKADLLVVDEFGKVHIYDFKVSRKDVGDFGKTSNEIIEKRDWDKEIEGEWPTTKKETAKYQLAIYAAILEQHGLTVSSASLIPIKLDFEYESEFKIKSLKKINLNTVTELEKDPIKKQVISVAGTTAGKQYRHIRRQILPVTKEVGGETIENSIKVYNEFFPGVEADSNVHRRDASVEYIRKHNVRELHGNHPEYKKGNRFSFYKSETDKTVEYFETEEDLLAAITSYVETVNSNRAGELIDFANIIESELHGERDYKKLGENFHPEKQATIHEQFKKYFIQDWKFNSDSTLNSFGIFEFEKDGEIEIVVITDASLFNTRNLGFGDTILGKNTKNKHVGSRKILDANYANLAMMKAMVYLAENQDSYKGKKIVQIRAFNPWFGQFSDNVTNSDLLENYEALRLRNPDSGAKQITAALFDSDAESIIKLIMSKSEMLDTKIVDFDEKYDAGQVQDLEKWCSKTMQQLKRDYAELNDPNKQRSSPAWEAFTLLNQMMLEINRITMRNETDPMLWMKSGHLGTMVTSAQFSASKNIQEFARLHDRYVSEVRMQVHKYGHEMQKAFKELYESEGNGTQAFESWFKRDADGKISDTFELMDPDDPNFKGSETSRRILRLYLDTMYKIRFPDKLSEASIVSAKASGAYYRVPLTEAVFSRQIKGLGFRKAIRNKIDQYKELTEGVFAGETEAKENYERNHDKLYNKFDLNSQQRADKIRDKGIGFFETNLEIVFNQVIVAYSKQQISEKYVPLFKAMQIGMRKMEEDGNNNLAGVRETLDKLIANRFYGKNVMSKDLQPIYKFLSVISAFFSTMKLGLNVRSFLRETLSGMYIGATRVMVKQHGHVSLNSYNKAVSYVIQDLPNNPSGISMVQQLNAIYGMANYSLGNVANQRRVNWLNINNWGRDTLFVGCSAPDYQHRMAILIAKMMDDGCWEAFSLNENEQLQYDVKKDKRFEAYFKGDKSDPKYNEQRTLFLKNIEEWNAQGYRKDDGTVLTEEDQFLPQPYTNREAQSVKNYADILYGHYDDESRSLLNDTFVGSFFMQYKTFVTAKLEQWIMDGGVYNVEYLKQQYDPITNEKLYEVIKYPNEDGTGMPYREIIKESTYNELSEEEKTQVRPYIEWTGQPMEGMARSAWRTIRAILGMSDEDLKEIWNDPHEKGLLLLGLSDLFIMGLLAILIKALYGAAVGSEEWHDINKDVRDSGYFASLSYSVLRGVTNDNNFMSIVSSMASDVNPPFLTNLKQFASSCWKVTIGDQSLAYALTRNVGAISDLSGMVKTWQTANKE